MAKTQKIVPTPDTSVDKVARKLLARSAATHPGTNKTAPSNGAVAAPISGTQVSGGASITGGRG
jgi:hypothetical protein